MISSMVKWSHIWTKGCHVICLLGKYWPRVESKFPGNEIMIGWRMKRRGQFSNSRTYKVELQKVTFLVWFSGFSSWNSFDIWNHPVSRNHPVVPEYSRTISRPFRMNFWTRDPHTAWLSFHMVHQSTLSGALFWISRISIVRYLGRV